MARIMWIGDGGTTTGFSRVTGAIGERLVADYGHEVHVLAIGYEAKYPNMGPLRLYRAEAGPAHHPLGFDRVVELLNRISPDIVVTLEDASTVHARLTANRSDPDGMLRQAKMISYLPVDGYNLPRVFRELLPMVRVVAMSKFGADQLGIDRIIHHGVDPRVFFRVDADHPLTLSTGVVVRSKADCREAFGLPADTFLIGRVDTNSGRKDWPSTWRVCDGFFRAYSGSSAALFHTKLKNPAHGVDLEALTQRGPGRYFVTGGGEWPNEDLVAFVNTFSVFLSTSRGEGFGLGNAEAMACGVPVVATNGSATTEVVGPGGILVDPLPVPWTNPYGVDMQLADTGEMTAALLRLAADQEYREALGEAAIEHVHRNFNWDKAASQMHAQITEVAGGVRAVQIEHPAARVGG